VKTGPPRACGILITPNGSWFPPPRTQEGFGVIGGHPDGVGGLLDALGLGRGGKDLGVGGLGGGGFLGRVGDQPGWVAGRGGVGVQSVRKPGAQERSDMP
jgi:hypothetical protein